MGAVAVMVPVVGCSVVALYTVVGIVFCNIVIVIVSGKSSSASSTTSVVGGIGC